MAAAIHPHPTSRSSSAMPSHRRSANDMFLFSPDVSWLSGARSQWTQEEGGWQQPCLRHRAAAACSRRKAAPHELPQPARLPQSIPTPRLARSPYARSLFCNVLLRLGSGRPQPAKGRMRGCSLAAPLLFILFAVPSYCRRVDNVLLFSPDAVQGHKKRTDGSNNA